MQITQEKMEIQEQIKQIKSRQLGRLITQLKAVNTPQIIIDATEKYFNYFLLDTLDLISLENQRKSGINYDKSKTN
jgi:hypothetical protein